MLERRDFLLAERGADRDREMASGIQHNAAAPVARLQAPGTSGVRAALGGSPVAYGSLRAAKCILTRRDCDVNSLTRRGTKSRSGQDLPWQCQLWPSRSPRGCSAFHSAIGPPAQGLLLVRCQSAELTFCSRRDVLDRFPRALLSVLPLPRARACAAYCTPLTMASWMLLVLKCFLRTFTDCSCRWYSASGTQ